MRGVANSVDIVGLSVGVGRREEMWSRRESKADGGRWRVLLYPARQASSLESRQRKTVGRFGRASANANANGVTSDGVRVRW